MKKTLVHTLDGKVTLYSEGHRGEIFDPRFGDDAESIAEIKDSGAQLINAKIDYAHELAFMLEDLLDDNEQDRKDAVRREQGERDEEARRRRRREEEEEEERRRRDDDNNSFGIGIDLGSGIDFGGGFGSGDGGGGGASGDW